MIGRRTNYRRPCLQKKMGQQSGMEIRISLESEVLLVISIYFVTLYRWSHIVHLKTPWQLGIRMFDRILAIARILMHLLQFSTSPLCKPLIKMYEEQGRLR